MFLLTDVCCVCRTYCAMINIRLPWELANCSAKLGVYSACSDIVIRFNWKINKTNGPRISQRVQLVP